MDFDDIVKIVDQVKVFEARLAAVEAERDAARAKRDAARAEVAHMKREQQAMIMQHRHDIRDLGQLLQDERCKVAAVEAAWYAVQAGQARAVEALEKILVGGNHLASALTGMFEDRLPPYGTDFNEARRAFAGSDEYDLWVCWAVIMRVRDSLSDPQPALDWLAQQRAEAAEAERRANTDVIRSLGPAFCDFFFDGPGDADYLAGVLAQQRREAAAEALKKLATDLRQDPWGGTLHDVDSLRGILRTRAAEIGAGGGE